MLCLYSNALGKLKLERQQKHRDRGKIKQTGPHLRTGYVPDGVVQKSIARKRCDEFFGGQRRSPPKVGQVKCLPACDVKKVKLKSEVGSTSEEGRKIGSFPIAHGLLPRSCETSPKKQRESRALRGDNVKDDGGYKAVFTEKGASASQVAAIRFLAIISKLPGMDEEANDAVSAHTQVHLSDAPRLLRLPERNAHKCG